MTLEPLLISSKQREAIREATGRVNVFEGAIRSGKTFSWLLLMLEKIATAGTGGAIMIVGKNRDSIFRNVFEPLFTWDVFTLWRPYIEYKQGAATASFFGRVVHIVGANDAKSESKIRGLTALLVFCDELTILDPAFFKQLLGRMSRDDSQLFGTTNPDNPAHWLKKEFLDRLDKLPTWRRFHFTIDDNPSLSDAKKAEYRAEYTGLWYKRFILGLWVAAEGAVFDSWDEHRHVVPWTSLPKMREILGVGIDYGTNHPTTALMLGLGMDDKLYLVDEWRYDSLDTESRWTDHKLSAGIKEWLAKPHLPYKNGLGHGHLIADPAGLSLRVQMKEDGMMTHPAEKDVQYGLRTMASLLAAEKLLVSDRCQGFIREAPGYSWDPKAVERGKDEPIKAADDSCDGARYAILTTEKTWRQWVTVSTPIAA